MAFYERTEYKHYTPHTSSWRIQSYIVVILTMNQSLAKVMEHLWKFRESAKRKLHVHLGHIKPAGTTPLPHAKSQAISGLPSPSPLPEFKRTPPRKMLLEKASLSQTVSSRQTFFISCGCRPVNTKGWFHWGLTLFFVTRVLCLVALLSSGSR